MVRPPMPLHMSNGCFSYASDASLPVTDACWSFQSCHRRFSRYVFTHAIEVMQEMLMPYGNTGTLSSPGMLTTPCHTYVATGHDTL